MGERLIGIDLGGTNIKALALTESGAVCGRAETPTPEAREAMVAAVRRLIDEVAPPSESPPRAIGLGAPGLAAVNHRSIAWMKGRLQALEGLDWCTALGGDKSNAPSVSVLNDAHGAVLGEAWLGAAAGRRNVMLLTLGTGVGGGAIVGGRLLEGHIGRAGHLGHITVTVDGPPDLVGTRGSLEDAVGDRTVRQRSGGRFGNTTELVAAVKAGDAEAQAVWQRSIHALACGLTSLINVLDPEIVILGGGISTAGDVLFTPLKAALADMEWRPLGTGVPIVPARLGAFAGAYGAALFARDGPTALDRLCKTPCVEKLES